jgi:hypothetical protein
MHAHPFCQKPQRKFLLFRSLCYQDGFLVKFISTKHCCCLSISVRCAWFKISCFDPDLHNTITAS